MSKAVPRKRPCKICRRWFLPNVRLKNRQKTCTDRQCQKEWHRRQCEDWNKKNIEYFKADYLAKKLKKITRAPPDSKTTKNDLPKSRIKPGLPWSEFQEVINAEHIVIIEYLFEQYVRRYQSAIRKQLTVNASKAVKNPP